MTRMFSSSMLYKILYWQPSHLRSPTWVLTTHRGNSFECATFLVSLLLGEGYNAYVVSGYASREQVRCDMTKRTCPYLPKRKPSPPSAKPKDTSKYRLKPPPDLRSQFLLEMEAREHRRKEEELHRQEEERRRNIQELEKPPPDSYWGRRIHAWVVVLPDRGGSREHQEVSEPFFIEPASGQSYFPKEHETGLLYLGVESIWNDQNYWVNMQTCSTGCADIDWDLSNVELWEHLLCGEPWTMRGSDEEGTEEEIDIQRDKHLDMPMSYVDKIDINSLDFERRYPNGSKTIFYKKTKVELYAPYVQMDGLGQRLTIYEDYEYMTALSIQEQYVNRADRLVESRKDLELEWVVDFYARGRPDACKEHHYFMTGQDTVSDERILQFYDVVRLDGLSCMEMHPTYLKQEYIGREDFLYYRYVEYSIEDVNDRKKRQVWKITEKYHRNDTIPAGKDIAIREFDLRQNEIQLKYHYDKGQGTRATRTFIKPPIAERGDRLTFHPDMTHGYDPDPMALPKTSLNLFYELDKQLKDEERCLSYIRDAEMEIGTFLKTRHSEYFMPKLTVSPFDRNRNEDAKARMFAKEEMLRAQCQREVEEDVDILGPYLARIGNPTILGKAQAIQIRQDCLNDFKKMVIDRANSILRMFEKCSQELEKTQSMLVQAEGLTREEEERILNETNEMNFYLHTLEVRLNRHRDLVPERYRMMLNMLREDGRLSVLY
ncbi:dynein regulatory complex subunit 7 isoform X2 [Orussus abietinus]|uniref:dynein regulatory complex subunit 7 isoform X2 n=1 Tax=Orussus abietinus TaxID=222816 RepID=UPI0006254BF8|nr:dynein regulatory complex subunit 7 isoform X2 [Orussus abietinus]